MFKAPNSNILKYKYLYKLLLIPQSTAILLIPLSIKTPGHIFKKKTGTYICTTLYNYVSVSDCIH